MAKTVELLTRTTRQTRGHVDAVRTRLEATLAWKVWERMLENDFVDRSVALAGKAFISFFPLVIVVAAFVPPRVRKGIFSTLTHRLGITGPALATARQAFASSNDIRRATGVLGLVFTVFFASAFTTALQRVFLRAWRRPPAGALGSYVRGPLWMLAIVAYMAALGGLRAVLPGAVGAIFFGLIALGLGTVLWWLTTWMMLMGQVRRRVLIVSGAIISVTLSAYAYAATLWMPNNVSSNTRQFGFFGVALSLVSWFSGAAICIMLGACAGPVVAEDPGPLGRLARLGEDALLVEGAPPSLPPPLHARSLREALTPHDAEALG